MKNKIQDGNTLTLTAPYDVKSGDGFQVGDIFAVAEYDAAEDAVVEGRVVNVFELPKKAADTVTLGLKLYWDDTNKEVTVTSTDNKFIGHATAAAAGADTHVKVRLVAN